MEIKEVWKNLKKGDKVFLMRDVYQRLDGTPYGGIYYEPPGHLIMKRGSIGTFSGKVERGVLVYFSNGIKGIVGLVLDDYSIEKYNGKNV